MRNVSCSNFYIGDYVRVRRGRFEGYYGRVATKDKDKLGIEFPKYHYLFNNLDNRIEDHHGYYFIYDSQIKAEEETENCLLSDLEKVRI